MSVPIGGNHLGVLDLRDIAFGEARRRREPVLGKAAARPQSGNLRAEPLLDIALCLLLALRPLKAGHLLGRGRRGHDGLAALGSYGSGTRRGGNCS